MELFLRVRRRALLVHEQPAARVDELARLRVREVAFALRHAHHAHLARRQQVHSRHRLVADGHDSLHGLDVDAREAVVVGEEGLVRRSHGQLHLGQLRQYPEGPFVLMDEAPNNK